MPVYTVKENLEESPVMFLTLKIVNNLPVFISSSYFEILISALEWYRDNKGIKIYAYTILINHIHLILEFDDNVVRSDRIIGDLKKYTANKIINKLNEHGNFGILNKMEQAALHLKDRKYKVWYRNSWPKAIYTEKFFDQKLAYIDFNATHHQIVEDIEKYPYTSYHNHYCEHAVLLETDEI